MKILQSISFIFIITAFLSCATEENEEREKESDCEKILKKEITIKLQLNREEAVQVRNNIYSLQNCGLEKEDCLFLIEGGILKNILEEIIRKDSKKQIPLKKILEYTLKLKEKKQYLNQRNFFKATYFYELKIASFENFDKDVDDFLKHLDGEDKTLLEKDLKEFKEFVKMHANGKLTYGEINQIYKKHLNDKKEEK